MKLNAMLSPFDPKYKTLVNSEDLNKSSIMVKKHRNMTT